MNNLLKFVLHNPNQSFLFAIAWTANLWKSPTVNIFATLWYSYTVWAEVSVFLMSVVLQTVFKSVLLIDSQSDACREKQQSTIHWVLDLLCLWPQQCFTTWHVPQNGTERETLPGWHLNPSIVPSCDPAPPSLSAWGCLLCLCFFLSLSFLHTHKWDDMLRGKLD